MTRIFEIKDRTERIIYLTGERWKHIVEHPEMSGQIEQIKETLIHPDIINKDEFEPDIQYYYKYYKERKEYLFIMVKYLNGEGFIITSFYTDKIK